MAIEPGEAGAGSTGAIIAEDKLMLRNPLLLCVILK